MKRLIQFLHRCVYEKRICLFYSYDWKQGGGQPGEHVSVYAAWDEIPEAFRKGVMPSPWLTAMTYRLKRGEAKLLCWSGDGQRLDAYGWVQDWRPFRRKFGEVAQTGTMLGPYWTAPKSRGQGLYGHLLAHSLTLCPPDQSVWIYTSPENKASQRGIEKAGFQFLGEWKLRVWLGIFSQLRRSAAKI